MVLGHLDTVTVKTRVIRYFWFFGMYQGIKKFIERFNDKKRERNKMFYMKQVSSLMLTTFYVLTHGTFLGMTRAANMSSKAMTTIGFNTCLAWGVFLILEIIIGVAKLKKSRKNMNRLVK